MSASDNKESDHESHHMEAFKRTGCVFGGVFNEIKNRYSKYASDIRDGFNSTCLISFIFVFTVCFATALTFGGILGTYENYHDPPPPTPTPTPVNSVHSTCFCFLIVLADKTNKWIGVDEMLLATSANGLFFSMFSGQPLMILGPTGPFLVFEEMLYWVSD